MDTHVRAYFLSVTASPGRTTKKCVSSDSKVLQDKARKGNIPREASNLHRWNCECLLPGCHFVRGRLDGFTGGSHSMEGLSTFVERIGKSEESSR